MQQLQPSQHFTRNILCRSYILVAIFFSVSCNFRGFLETIGLNRRNILRLNAQNRGMEEYLAAVFLRGLIIRNASSLPFCKCVPTGYLITPDVNQAVILYNDNPFHYAVCRETNCAFFCNTISIYDFFFCEEMSQFDTEIYCNTG